MPMDIIHFRRMTPTDLDFVEDIANRSFVTPWSVKTFQREIENNERGHYWVLTITPNSNSTDSSNSVVSYGGYWLLDDEAHIVSVATHPKWRQRGLGKQLVRSMMEEAARAGAESITLEVRESNQVALNIYASLGFIEKGRRKEYYSKGGTSREKEDALILTYENLGEAFARKAFAN